jgi:hypothetical protein
MISFVYEFYIDKRIKILSKSFLCIIGCAVSLPFYAALFIYNYAGGAVDSSQMYRIYGVRDLDVPVKENHIRRYRKSEIVGDDDESITLVPYQSAPIQDLNREGYRPSTCQIAWENAGLKRRGPIYRTFEIKGGVFIPLYSEMYHIYIYLLGQLFDEASLGAMDAFGCTIEDSERNKSLPVFGYLFFLSKILNSIFVISVLGAPFAKISYYLSKRIVRERLIDPSI